MEDPEALKTIMDDPQVKAYMNQVEDLMKDPAMKQQVRACEERRAKRRSAANFWRGAAKSKATN